MIDRPASREGRTRRSISAPTPSSGGFFINRWSVGLPSRSGLNVTQHSDPSSRIVGNACRVEGDRITAEREGPTTWRAGKVEAIDQYIGRRPVLAVGDTWTDLEMLQSARSLSILVDRGDAELATIADESGWLRVAAGDFDVESPRVSG